MSSQKGFILVMGVSGAGKTTIASAIAEAFSGEFLDADTLHPPQNIAAMQAGVPLTDDMRSDWLGNVAESANALARTATGPVAIACSALKASYRARLRHDLGEMFVVFLDGDKETIRPRIERRAGHFMPPSLLDSQFADLEPPRGEPDKGIHLDVAADIETIVTASCKEFRRVSAHVGTQPSASPGRSRAALRQ